MLCLAVQSCPVLCEPMDCSLSGSSKKSTGILQARILEWVAMPSSWDLPFGPPFNIFPTQGSNTGLPHCRRVFYILSHQGSPRILCIAFAYHGQISRVWVMWAALRRSTGLCAWDSFHAVDLHLPVHRAEQSYPQTGCYRPLAGNLRIDHRPQVQRKQFKKLVANGRFLVWFILLSD